MHGFAKVSTLEVWNPTKKFDIKNLFIRGMTVQRILHMKKLLPKWLETDPDKPF